MPAESHVLSSGLVAVHLPDCMYLTPDPLTITGLGAQVDISLAGTMIRQVSEQSEGFAVSLTTGDDGVVDLATVEAVRDLALDDARCTLTLIGGAVYTVDWDHAAGALSVRAVWGGRPLVPTDPADPYRLTLYFLLVGVP